jgi:hypothetical protein
VSSRFLLFGHGINCHSVRCEDGFLPRLHTFFLPLPQFPLLVVLAIFKAQESLIPTTFHVSAPPPPVYPPSLSRAAILVYPFREAMRWGDTPVLMTRFLSAPARRSIATISR